MHQSAAWRWEVRHGPWCARWCCWMLGCCFNCSTCDRDLLLFGFVSALKQVGCKMRHWLRWKWLSALRLFQDVHPCSLTEKSSKHLPELQYFQDEIPCLCYYFPTKNTNFRRYLHDLANSDCPSLKLLQLHFKTVTLLCNFISKCSYIVLFYIILLF